MKNERKLIRLFHILSKSWVRIFLSIPCLLIGLFSSGCTVNKVTCYTAHPVGAPIKTSEVKVISKITDADKPYQVEGMLRTMVLPVMRNTPEARENLATATAAKMGINGLVGLLPGKSSYCPGFEQTSGLFARFGASQSEGENKREKFIICMPHAKFRMDQTAQTAKIDSYLRDEIQYNIGERGYYAYPCENEGVDAASIMEGKVNVDSFRKPLGIDPDYALLCDVEGYDKKGVPVMASFYSLKINLSLFDLKDRKVVWTTQKTGGSGEGMLLPGGLIWALVMNSDDHLRESIYALVSKMMKEIPEVPGCRKL